MPNLKAGEQLLLVDTFFLILLTSFGSAVTGVSLTPLQTIQFPQLAPLPQQKNASCAWWDFICQATGSGGIAQATAYIGWAAVNTPVVLIYFVSVMVVYANLILSITFSPAFSSQGIPVVGPIFIIFQLFVAMQVFRDWRGSNIL